MYQKSKKQNNFLTNIENKLKLLIQILLQISRSIKCFRGKGVSSQRIIVRIATKTFETDYCTFHRIPLYLPHLCLLLISARLDHQQWQPQPRLYRIISTEASLIDEILHAIFNTFSKLFDKTGKISLTSIRENDVNSWKFIIPPPHNGSLRRYKQLKAQARKIIVIRLLVMP